MKNCLICHRIDLIKQKKNPYFVIELDTGFVVIGDHQYFKGYTLFLCKQHVFELHQLEENFKLKFLKEMSLVAEAVYKTFKPKKLNYELLGNGDPHLHWHIFPRHHDDPNLKKTVWTAVGKSIREAKTTKPSPQELQKLKTKLLAELKKLKIS